MQIVQDDWCDGEEEFTGGTVGNEPGKIGRGQSIVGKG